jgi:hypothetical protein
VGGRTSKSVHDGCTAPHRLGGVHSRYCYFLPKLGWPALFHYSIIRPFPQIDRILAAGAWYCSLHWTRVFFLWFSNGGPCFREHSSPRISSKRLFWWEHLQHSSHSLAYYVRHLSTTCKVLPGTQFSVLGLVTALPPTIIRTLCRRASNSYCGLTRPVILRRGGVPTDSGMESRPAIKT